ncbi:MAG: Na+/H+ antiporter NhaA [Gammaproteobacteria bacterium]|nr:Na+/H+ antiporter NhaA [Gammaproteobacteria bacterium]
MRVLSQRISELLKHEAAGGVLLLIAAAFALIIDNSALSNLYHSILQTPFVIGLGNLSLDKPLLLWINDGLMALFFLLVGLEIKRELIQGNLSTVRQAILPALAAIGGMAMPAIIYSIINQGDPVALRGWAVPAATDIAFAVGVLALLGTRIPIGLKVFLLTLAVIDDLGVILIIAVFYTAEVSLHALLVAGGAGVMLLALNKMGVNRLLPYILVGLVMWVAVLKSGVHATLAGVAIAFFIPLRTKDPEQVSPLLRAEHSLQPYVMLLVMPVFAFANAGVRLIGLTADEIFGPVPFGIALGLFFGNQIGIMGVSFLIIKLKLCELPKGVTWLQLWGASALAGIGFTMSLFIGMLAFTDPSYQASLRIGVLSGSLVSGILGYAILRYMCSRVQEPAKAG